MNNRRLTPGKQFTRKGNSFITSLQLFQYTFTMQGKARQDTVSNPNSFNHTTISLNLSKIGTENTCSC